MKNFTFLFFAFFVIHLTAQSVTDTYSTIYLYDGSFLRGQVLQETPETIDIQLVDGSLVQLPIASVRDVSTIKRQLIKHQDGRYETQRGQVINVNLLFAGGRDYLNEEQQVWGLGGQFTVGYRWSPYLQVSGGLDLMLLERLFAATIVDLRGQLNQKQVSPYYSLQAGYSFPAVFSGNQFANYQGGWLWYPAVGLNFASRKKSNFQMDIGYRTQRTTQQFEGWTTVTERIRYNRIVLRVGWEF